MARYIDADKLCEALKSMASVQPTFKQSTILGVVSSIENFPTADVVPKSEVEREIFGDIESFFRRYDDDQFYFLTDMENDIAELKKKYTEGE